MNDLSLQSWHAFMALPRGTQPSALRRWLAALPGAVGSEAWNESFGPASLFDAWTRTSVVQGLHRTNREALATLLSGRTDVRLVEIGGGDGRLWSGATAASGTLTVIDPAPEVGPRVRLVAPDHLHVDVVTAPVEQTLGDGELWRDLDAVVCSLTLHHVAGASAAERRAHGLEGPGKLEVLRRIAKALRPDGLLFLNEADVHCDLEIPPGPLLADRLIDSYVRRCARSVLHDIAERPDADDDLRARWTSIVHRWCLEQVRYADVPVVERDVYELDVPRWLALLSEAGLEVVERGFTDEAFLFHRYVLRRRG